MRPSTFMTVVIAIYAGGTSWDCFGRPDPGGGFSGASSEFRGSPKDHPDRRSDSSSGAGRRDANTAPARSTAATSKAGGQAVTFGPQPLGASTPRHSPSSIVNPGSAGKTPGAARFERFLEKVERDRAKNFTEHPRGTAGLGPMSPAVAQIDAISRQNGTSVITGEPGHFHARVADATSRSVVAAPEVGRAYGLGLPGVGEMGCSFAGDSQTCFVKKDFAAFSAGPAVRFVNGQVDAVCVEASTEGGLAGRIGRIAKSVGFQASVTAASCVDRQGRVTVEGAIDIGFGAPASIGGLRSNGGASISLSRSVTVLDL